MNARGVTLYYDMWSWSRSIFDFGHWLWSKIYLDHWPNCLFSLHFHALLSFDLFGKQLNHCYSGKICLVCWPFALTTVVDRSTVLLEWHLLECAYRQAPHKVWDTLIGLLSHTWSFHHMYCKSWKLCCHAIKFLLKPLRKLTVFR